MKKALSLILCLFFVTSLSGCIKTYTYQVERKDQDIIGNKGVIYGEVPPDEIGRVRTRSMGGADVTLPPSKEYKSRKKTIEEGGAEEPVETRLIVKRTEDAAEAATVYVEPIEITEPEAEKGSKGFADEQWVKREEPKEEIVRKTAPAVKMQSTKIAPQEIKYTVQKGDTLEKIAKNFLGKASRWPEIFEANKDILKSPSKIYPGQVITILQVPEEEKEIEEAYK